MQVESSVSIHVGMGARVSDDFLCRGRGQVLIGDYCSIEERVIVDLGTGGRGGLAMASRAKLKVGVIIRCYNGEVSLGHHSTVGDYCVLCAHGGVRIGAHVGIGSHCSFTASSHTRSHSDVPFRYQGETAVGITIGDDVWMGAGVRVLDGCNIGDSTTVGAGSVVTRSLPRQSVCAGAPCRPVRKLLPREQMVFTDGEALDK